jgi:Arc/MetJ-type ribon-helix-helix transcriptional regulator
MKSIQVELPDQIADQLNQLVASGWFHDDAEGIRIALMDYIQRHKPAWQEQHQLEDIAWAISQSES